MRAEPMREREETPVDDVRRVREQLDREYGGDLRRHVRDSNAVARRLATRLGVKLVRVGKGGRRSSGRAKARG